MAKSTSKIVTIEDFKVTNLAEFQGKKEQQEQLVKDNPFLEITDTETYEVAKKHRTALVSGRTSLDKEKKAVAKRIKEIIVEPVAKAYEDLIAISTPHETKQQEEVKRYETKKEEERKEKQRKEKERVDFILNKISIITHIVTNEINSLGYSESLTYEINPFYEGKEVKEEDFEEYTSKYISEIEALKFTLEQRKSFLAAEEKNRLEAIELQKQRNEQNRIESIKSAIFNFNSRWQRAVTNLQENEIEDVLQEFNAIADEDYQEFQNDYITTKEQIQLALNNRINQINQQIELDKQKEQMIAIQRRGHLASLGFDYNTLIYEADGNKLAFSEDELKGTDQEFLNILNYAKQTIEEFNKPEPQPKSEPEPVNQPDPVQQPTVIPEPEQKISKNQVRSIEFLNNFVAYCEANISTPIDLNIKNFVLSNVK